MADKAFGARVWGGDPTTVAEARRLYTQDHDEGLIRYAVALYSFRSRKQFAEELLRLRPELLVRARRDLETTVRGNRALSLANEVDVLSTLLAWVSRQDGLEDSRCRLTRLVALRLCEEGMSLTSNAPDGHHTRALLRLTRAELLFEDDEKTVGRSHLWSVARRARGITDANQRARVMRKLGALLRRHGRFWSGVLWGLRACLIRGIPMAVRLKSIAALLGVDR